jgi:hypothetical protein
MYYTYVLGTAFVILLSRLLLFHLWYEQTKYIKIIIKIAYICCNKSYFRFALGVAENCCILLQFLQNLQKSNKKQQNKINLIRKKYDKTPH